MKKKSLTDIEYQQLKKLIETNKNKTVHKRLRVIELWYEGYSQEEISKMTGYANRKTVNIVIKRFKEQGLEKFAKLKYGNNRRNLSFDREKEILESIVKKVESGEFVTVKSIKEAFDLELGRDTSNYVYKVLKRHNRRSVIPRPKHPNGASDEEIEASKKLTQPSKS